MENPEIGRELRASDLKPQQVVVLSPPGRDFHLTMWVRAIDDKNVAFLAGDLNWTVINFIQPDGTLVDDLGRRVAVFEYLGKI